MDEDNQEVYNELVEANAARVKTMAEEFNSFPEPYAILNTRLNCLMAALLNPEQRLQVETMIEGTIAAQLDASLENLRAQKTRSTLLAGVPGVDPGNPLPTPSSLFHG